LSFRTKREIFPRSLAFARDDRPWACPLASWRLGESNIRTLRVLRLPVAWQTGAFVVNPTFLILVAALPRWAYLIFLVASRDQLKL